MMELFIVMIVTIVVVLIVLVILLSLKGRLGTYPYPPTKLLPVLRREIQLRGFPCSEEKPGVLSVRKDSLVRVKIHLRPLEGGTKVLYEIDATQLGWALVFILLFVPYAGWIGIIAALYIHFSGRTFSRDVIGRLIIPLSLEEPLPRRDRVRETLLSAIAEGESLVTETREYERLVAWSIGALVGLGGLVLWCLLFFIPLFYLGFSFLEAIILATGVAPIVVAPGIYLSTRKGRERMRELNDWRFRLSTRRQMELAGRHPETESTFDLVMKVSQISHVWRSRLKKLKLWHHPVAGIEIFLWFWGGIIFLIIGLSGPELPWPLAFVLVVLGIFFLFGGLFTATRWRSKVSSEFERDKKLWEEKMIELQECMGNYLRKL